MRYAVALAIALLVAGGCARRPPEPPQAPVIGEARPPAEAVGEAAEALPEPAAPTPAPEAPAASADQAAAQPAADADARPTPAGAAPDKPRGEKLPWRVPEGPLDDAKFIVISAKYTVAAIKFAEKDQADQETLMEVLKGILKEGHVEVDEYIDYAAQVHDDPERGRKVGDAIIRLAEERGGIKLTDEAMAALGGLEPKAIVEAE